MIRIEKEIPRIALVKLGSIGDCIHTLPLAASLKQTFPKAYIAWVVEEKSREILSFQKEIDEVIVVDTRDWRQLFKKGKWMVLINEVGEFRKQLSSLNFDLAIDGQGLIKSGLITYFTGAPLRIGYSRKFCREGLNTLFTTHRVDPVGDYVIDQTLSLVRDLKNVNRTPNPLDQSFSFEYVLSPDSVKRVSEWLHQQGLEGSGDLVALHPGAAFKTKRWPLDRFLALSELLVIRDKLSVLITPAETLKDLENLVTTRKIAPIVVPPLSLNELAALYQKCKVVVAGDTGPLHLAGTVGCSTVGLFGPSDGRRSAPSGKQHRNIQRSCPCRGMSRYFPRQCRSHNWCMEEIKVEDVYSMITDLLVQ